MAPTPSGFSLDDKFTPVPILRDSKLDLMSSHRRSFEKVFVMEFDDGPPVDTPPRTKRFFCWFLTKKQWTILLVCSIATVVILLLVLMLLGIVPMVFQSNIDKVQLSINYMDIKSMSTAADVNTIDVELSIHVEAHASVSSTMDPAEATLFYQSKPFSTVTLPAQSLTSGANSFDFVLRNQAEISDVDVFHALSKALITQETVSVEAHALVKAHAMGLTFSDLKLDREFTIKAFNQFRDPKPAYNNIALSECTDTAYKMLINVTLDNVAQVGISGIGALNMSVYYQQSYLGQAISADASLGIPRGPTPMVLELTIEKSLKTMPALTGMLSGMLAMNAEFYATGNHPYATKAVLLQDAFAELNMSMPYVDGLKKVTLNPKCDLLSLLSASTGAATNTSTSTAASTNATTDASMETPTTVTSAEPPAAASAETVETP